MHASKGVEYILLEWNIIEVINHYIIKIVVSSCNKIKITITKTKVILLQHALALIRY